jgi:pyruvate-formate lyase
LPLHQNELTYLIIDVFKYVSLTDPQINVRYHEGTPNRLLDQILNFGSLGPVPMIYNDHTVIDALLNIGVELTDARDYCIDACQDLMIAEKSDFYPIFAGIYGIHLLTILERVVGRLSQHTTFDQFWADLKHEMRIDIASFVEQSNRADKILPIISPVPFLSSTLEGCIETGRDKTEGGTIYNFTGFVGGGLVNVANSAAAIRKIVFEERRIEPHKMVEALKKEYEGMEPLRQSMLNDSPKFGNNDDAVDLLAVELANYFCDEVNKCKNPRGGRFVAGFFSHHQARLGKVVHATADGRKQGEPLAVSLSPSNGTEKQGPTGAILSAAKIDQRKCPLGTSLDLTFYGPSVHEREEREKIVALIRSYMDLGGIELQINLLDPEILRDAQKNPDLYKDLVVRVWGFNAYFVSLKPEYQEEIISRIEGG